MSAATKTIEPTEITGHPRRWLILAILCLCLVLVVARVSSLNVAIPSIQGALDASQSQLQWIIDAYALVFAGLLLPMGALGDRYGRKWTLLGGLGSMRRGRVRLALDEPRPSSSPSERSWASAPRSSCLDAVAVDVGVPTARTRQGHRDVGRVRRRGWRHRRGVVRLAAAAVLVGVRCSSSPCPSS